MGVTRLGELKLTAGVLLLTFAVRGLDYPGAVQVVGVKVWESR